MKVILVNSSPHAHGSTHAALSEIAAELSRQNVESEILHIGSQPIRGCIGCGWCRKGGKCVHDDVVNELAGKLAEADGLIFGTPVYFAGISGQLKSFMDRLFYAYSKQLAYKPAAAVVVARRGGCTAAFDDVNKYFSYACMPIVSSQYWNQAHGNSGEEVRQDEEGLQIMRTLGRNMAWMLKCIEAGKQAGIPLPERERTIRTNFIR